jgi:hypothetical protein
VKNKKRFLLGLIVLLSGSCEIPDYPYFIEIASQLNGLRWEVPVIESINDYLYSCTDPPDTQTTFHGDSATKYEVHLRFRGIIETRPYQNGSHDGFWQTGGSYSSSNSFNVYCLSISDPAQIYYLNYGESVYNCYVVDYTQTIYVKDGATVTLSVSTIDNRSVKTIGTDENNLTISDIERADSGQFLQMEVLDISPIIDF